MESSKCKVQSSETEELKPCPFCGEKRLAYSRGLDTEIQGVLCLGCKARVKFPISMAPRETFGENEKKWISAWNRRAKEGKA